jgi:putative ABC transport system substrate-binding protein
MSRAAVLCASGTGANQAFVRAAETVAPSLGVKLTAIDVRDDVNRAVGAFAGEPDGGLVVVPNPYVAANREAIIALAARHRLPAVYPFRFFAVAGGLMSYGIDQVDQWRRAAGYVDRILRGEKPGDLPVQTPTKFELVIYLKTAKAIGLNVPPAFPLRADEVIE